MTNLILPRRSTSRKENPFRSFTQMIPAPHGMTELCSPVQVSHRDISEHGWIRSTPWVHESSLTRVQAQSSQSLIVTYLALGSIAHFKQGPSFRTKVSWIGKAAELSGPTIEDAIRKLKLLGVLRTGGGRWKQYTMTPAVSEITEGCESSVGEQEYPITDSQEAQIIPATSARILYSEMKNGSFYSSEISKNSTSEKKLVITTSLYNKNNLNKKNLYIKNKAVMKSIFSEDDFSKKIGLEEMENKKFLNRNREKILIKVSLSEERTRDAQRRRAEQSIRKHGSVPVEIFESEWHRKVQEYFPGVVELPFTGMERGMARNFMNNFPRMIVRLFVVQSICDWTRFRQELLLYGREQIVTVPCWADAYRHKDWFLLRIYGALSQSYPNDYYLQYSKLAEIRVRWLRRCHQTVPADRLATALKKGEIL